MKSHGKIKTLLYSYLHAELSGTDRTAVESHLKVCSQCSAELKSLQEAAAMLDAHFKRPSESRSDLYWQQFTEKVERRIERESEPEESFVHRVLDVFLVHRKPFGVGFATALVLVFIAIGAWNLWLKNPAIPPGNGQTEEMAGVGMTGVQNAALETQAQDYLEQSKVLLISLVNTDTKSLSGGSSALQKEKELSRKLVNESAMLTSKLNDPSQRQMKELIADLQLILVQIANLSNNQEAPGVEIIKGGIEHNGILFKINLEQIQRATKSSPRIKTNVKQTS